MRDCWHSVGDFTPEYERPGICTKGDACLSTEGVYCSRCVYYGKHQSFQATAGFRDYAPTSYSSSNGWSVFYQLPNQRNDSQAYFFFNDTATAEIYTLSLHDALPI